MKCRYCSKEIPNRRHEGLCPQRPDRPNGASRPGSSRKPRKAKTITLNGAQDILEPIVEEMPEAEMPVFDAVPEAPVSEPVAYDAPAAAPAPPAGMDGIFWDSIVSFICDGFDVAVKGQIGDKPAAPQPPESVSKEDREKLAAALGAAMQAYGSSAAVFIGKWGPALNLAFVGGAVFLPRVMAAREYIRFRQEQERDRRRLAAAVAERPGVILTPGEDATSVGDAMIKAQLQRMADLNPINPHPGG